jgi:plastocyanin
MRTNLALFAFLALAALAACGDDSTGSSAPSAADLCAGSGAAATVDVKEYAFTPSRVTITSGQAVCWANTGKMTHTVPGGGTLPPGQTFVHAFFGNTVFYCGFHSTMVDTLTVN